MTVRNNGARFPKYGPAQVGLSVLTNEQLGSHIWAVTSLVERAQSEADGAGVDWLRSRLGVLLEELMREGRRA